MVVYLSGKILESLVGASGKFSTNIGENTAQYGVHMGLGFLLDLSASLFPFEAGLTNADKSVAPCNLHSFHHAFAYHAQDGVVLRRSRRIPLLLY